MHLKLDILRVGLMGSFISSPSKTTELLRGAKLSPNYETYRVLKRLCSASLMILRALLLVSGYLLSKSTDMSELAIGGIVWR